MFVCKPQMGSDMLSRSCTASPELASTLALLLPFASSHVMVGNT